MIYPLLSEYIDAILSPEDSFDQLKDLHPVLDVAGRPIMSSGNFAVVFKMEDALGKQYALKCFLREQEGRQSSYSLITKALDRVDSPFFLKVRYLQNELFVDTSTSKQTEFDVLVMDWVEGMTLDKYIKKHIDSNYYLSDLAYRFSILANWLFEQPLAHGDLKPDNIIVKNDGQLVLVDYDGMFVPGMEGQEAREIGSPDFRHPGRSNQKFDARIDDFPLASILLSLKLIAIKPELLEQYGAQDRLLFSANDYLNPDKCPLLDENLASGWEIDHIRSDFIWLLKYGDLYHSLSVLEDPIMDYGFADVSDEDLASAIEDSYGVKYSQDGLRLLQAPSSLTEYSVKDGTLCVCRKAFVHCPSLKTVRFPETVARIGSLCFNECSELQEISIPPKVTVIERETFKRCWNLSNVYIRSKLLTKIDVEAFLYCKSLTHIEIPDTVKKIGTRAFQHCEKLMVVRLPASLNTIDWDAFSGCISLTAINLAEIKEIGETAFAGCSSLQTLFIPDSVIKIGNRAFAGCSSLSSVRFPNNIKTIGKTIFSGCSSLRAIYGEDIPIENLELILNGELITICDKTITQYSVPDSISIIPESAFSNCKALKKVILHDKITRIGWKAFSGCEALESIIIPASVNRIDDYAFEGCTSLKSIQFLGRVNNIAYGTFCGCESLTEIQLPEGLETIGQSNFDWYEHEVSHYDYETGAFSGCKSLHSITIPNTVADISRASFSDCKSLTIIHLPNTISVISSRMFANCESLETIVLPSSVHTIGDYAFEGCKSLKSIRIPSKVVDIGNGTFLNCESLTEVQLPEGLKTIGELHLEDEYGQNYDYQITGAFIGCKSLKTINIPHSVVLIGASTFQRCTSLVEVLLPDGVEEIGDYAFCLCESLKEFEMPSSIKSIGSYCFYGCKELSNVIIHSRTVALGYRTFEDCYSLESFVSDNASKDKRCLIINGVLEAFAPKGIIEYRIPEGISRIEQYAFFNCETLERIILPESIREIGYAAFADCSLLSSINIPISLKRVEDSAFDNCPCEKNLVFPNEVEYKSDPYRWLDEANEHQYRI